MQTITLLNEKGGVGKTTLAGTLAAGLAIRGYRVMMVDADPQGDLTLGFGMTRSPGLFKLLVDNASFSDVAISISPEVYEHPGKPVDGKLFLIPGHQHTRAITTMIDNSWAVADRFEDLQDSIDIVIFDTPPTPSLLHGSIYLATDYVVYPTELEYFSFTGLVDSLQSRAGYNKERLRFGRTEIELMGIVPTKFRRSTLEHQENLESLQEQFGNLVWNPVPLSIVWGEATRFQRSIFNHAPDSSGTRVAWKLVNLAEKVLTDVKA
jgi:chromosome partitioning protein